MIKLKVDEDEVDNFLGKINFDEIRFFFSKHNTFTFTHLHFNFCLVFKKKKNKIKIKKRRDGYQ